MPRKRIPLDVNYLVERYNAGASAHALAKECGLTASSILIRLKDAGVSIRTHGDSQRLRFERPDEAAALAANRERAQAAWRGQRHSIASKERAALTRERNQTSISPVERDLNEWLLERGLQPIQQKACGIYNLDFAIGNVGVEVLGGFWHKDKAHAARLRYLFDAGWNLVMIWVHATKYPLRVAAADYVAAFADEANREPPLRSQYRVIWGSGKEIARGSGDTDELARIPTTRGQLNTRG